MSNYKTLNTSALAEAFKALSNPNRLEIYQQLLGCCTPGTACSPELITGYCVGELGANVAVAPSTLSHHIKELQRAGLIVTQRKGKNVECFVDPVKVQTLKEFFENSELNLQEE